MSGPNHAQTPIFDRDDEIELLRQGLLTPASNGCRRVHKRRLQSSSSEDDNAIPLTPISWDSDLDSDLFAVVPDLLNSYQTLIYLGFDEKTADHLWDIWTHWDSENRGPRLDVEEGGLPRIEPYEGTSFVGLAKSHIRASGADATTDDAQSWRNCMTACGIDGTLQDDIMDPFFNDVRMTESCHFWLEDTMEMRYRGLKDFQATSRERAQAARRQAAGPGDSSEHQAGGGNTASSRRTISGQMSSEVSWISPHTSMSDQAKLAGQNAPGSITLFKGLDQARIRHLRDADNNIDIDQLEGLASRTPTDFAKEPAYYFVVDRDVALMYALWAKRRESIQSIVLVQINIRNSDIKSLSESEKLTAHYPSEEWKKLVWHCRQEKRLRPELRKFRLASLIIGTISRKPDESYRAMHSWNEIQDRDILKLDSRPAVQYAFLQDEPHDIVSRNASSIQVFPVTAAELNQATNLMTDVNN